MLHLCIFLMKWKALKVSFFFWYFTWLNIVNHQSVAKCICLVEKGSVFVAYLILCNAFELNLCAWLISLPFWGAMCRKKNAQCWMVRIFIGRLAYFCKWLRAKSKDDRLMRWNINLLEVIILLRNNWHMMLKAYVPTCVMGCETAYLVNGLLPVCSNSSISVTLTIKSVT